jgi:hypothetical protein
MPTPGKNRLACPLARTEIASLPFVLIELGFVNRHRESLAPAQRAQDGVEQRRLHHPGPAVDPAP